MVHRSTRSDCTVMIVLNFSHPLTAEHLARIEALSGQAVGRVIDVPAQFDHA